MQISIISELNEENRELQIWTFNIDAHDLLNLMQKYDGRGASLLDDADGIAEEIKQLYK